MTDLFGAYKSQSTVGLQRIDSSKYPDTNKDFESNVRRLNSFVDYISEYLQQMQKGVDQANTDPITQIRDTILGIGSLLGGGELLYGIDLGDLQYFLPALAAMFGFDSSQPFPLNLFYAAEHFLLGYILPLDSWNVAIEGIIDGWLVALGLTPTFIDAVHLVFDNLARFTNDVGTIINDLLGVLGIFSIFDFLAGPVGPIWGLISDILAIFNIANLGHIVDPFLETLTPWIHTFGILIGYVDDFVEAMIAGLGGGDGILHNVMSWVNDFLGIFGLSGDSGIGSGAVLIPAVENIPILGPVLDLLGDIPIVGPLIIDLVNLLGGFLSGGDTTTTNPALTELSGLLHNIPLIGPLIEMFVGPASGLFGLLGLNSIINDLLGVLGLDQNSGLGTGDVHVPILGDIPLLGPVIDWIVNLPLHLLANVMDFLDGVFGGTGKFTDMFCASVDTGGNFISGISGIFGNTTGSSNGSIFSMISNCVQNLLSGVLGSSTASMVTSAGIGIIQLISDPFSILSSIKTMVCSVIGLDSPIDTSKGELSISSLFTEVVGLFTNPTGDSSGSLFCRLVRLIQTVAPCRMTPIIGSLASVVTGIFDNASGSSNGSFISQIISKVCEMITFPFKMIYDMTLNVFEIFKNPTGSSDGSLISFVCNKVKSLFSGLFGGFCNELLPSIIGGFGLFQNTSGSSGGSIVSQIISKVCDIITCPFRMVSELVSGVLNIFTNQSGSSNGSIISIVCNKVKSIFSGIFGSLSGGAPSMLLNFIGSPFGTNSDKTGLGSLISCVSSLFGFGDTTGTDGGIIGTLTNLLTDFFGLFGSPSGIGTGLENIVINALENIPILGPMLKLTEGFFGGFSSFLSGLGSIFGGGGISTIFGGGPSSIFGSSNTALNNLFSWMPNLLTGFTSLPMFQLNTLHANTDNNLIPDPYFNNHNNVQHNDEWQYGLTSNGGSWTTSGGTGDYRELLGVPVSVHAGQVIDAGLETSWAGVHATGPTIQLAINAYDSNDNFISTALADSATINDPSVSSDWRALSGQFLMPSNTSHARTLLTVSPQATAAGGSVSFRGKVYLQADQRIDAGQLGNVTNIPQLFPTSIWGTQGIPDLSLTLQHMFDGLGSAFNFGGGLTNVPLSQLFGLAQGVQQNAASAVALGAGLQTRVKALEDALAITSPADYQGPQETSFTTIGNHTYAIPSWFASGDLLDVLLVGSGGGGGAGGYLPGQGGQGGLWSAYTLTYGTHIPLSTTSLMAHITPGGLGGGGVNPTQDGTRGGDTTVTGTGVTTLTGAGGQWGAYKDAGGNNSLNPNTTSHGLSPGSETFAGKTYFGGAEVGPNQNGSSPGGGGGGFESNSNFTFTGFPGAPGAVIFTARRPSSGVPGLLVDGGNAAAAGAAQYDAGSASVTGILYDGGSA